MRTELWYTDEHTRDVRFSMKVVEQIASKKSAVQQIDIFDTSAYGRVLVLDGGLMITEKDEFIYHEMITHVPMAVHPRVRNVLVIGGGDGGTVRELTKYRTIESIDLVEVDKHVVLLAKKYLPFTSAKLKDKRVRVWFEEGLRYVRGKKAEYDLIIVDSSDPYGPIPSYPSGHWLFGFASKKYHPIGDLNEARWNKLRINTRYYNTALHRGAFALPNYVLDILKEEEHC